MSAQPQALPIANAFSVDVEDYFHVSAFSGRIDREEWEKWPCRVEASTETVLRLLAENGASGTFFILGWIAERYPGLVRWIAAEGHEIASHGNAHERVSTQSPEAFRDDVRRTRSLLEDISGTAVKGFRAPSFSMTEDTVWAFDILAEEGYRYSSSVYPIRHDHYGLPSWPRRPHKPRGDGGILEVPVATLRLFGRNLPCGGGGYFRLSPSYRISRWALREANRRDAGPSVVYFHPWEVDTGQPRVPDLPLAARLRHYTNLDRMESRLRRLLRDFRWDRMDNLFLETAASAHPDGPCGKPG
jgi:polysaccharide deacetylase family protein (PEP-CTERM system associated)